MKDLNLTIGRNLRRIREGLGISLDKVAEATGVSKSMLGQIERGETSPTITILWKIANGLKVSFTSLTKEESRSVSVVHEDGISPMKADEGRYSLYPLFPFDSDRRFEIYSVKLEPGCVFHAEGHLKGEEYVIVFHGQLNLTVNGEVFEITKGNGLKFLADKPHTYHNPGDFLTEVSMIIYYPSEG
jgi:XRE family transcriptional regulator, regulator of sulfur utilization